MSKYLKYAQEIATETHGTHAQRITRLAHWADKYSASRAQDKEAGLNQIYQIGQTLIENAQQASTGQRSKIDAAVERLYQALPLSYHPNPKDQLSQVTNALRQEKRSTGKSISHLEQLSSEQMALFENPANILTYRNITPQTAIRFLYNAESALPSNHDRKNMLQGLDAALEAKQYDLRDDPRTKNLYNLLQERSREIALPPPSATIGSVPEQAKIYQAPKGTAPQEAKIYQAPKGAAVTSLSGLIPITLEGIEPTKKELVHLPLESTANALMKHRLFSQADADLEPLEQKIRTPELIVREWFNEEGEACTASKRSRYANLVAAAAGVLTAFGLFTSFAPTFTPKTLPMSYERQVLVSEPYSSPSVEVGFSQVPEQLVPKKREARSKNKKTKATPKSTEEDFPTVGEYQRIPIDLRMRDIPAIDTGNPNPAQAPEWREGAEPEKWRGTKQEIQPFYWGGTK